LPRSADRRQGDRLEDILKKGVVAHRRAARMFRPFGSQNQAREAEGFDVELARMWPRRWASSSSLQQVTGANRIPFLLTEQGRHS